MPTTDAEQQPAPDKGPATKVLAWLDAVILVCTGLVIFSSPAVVLTADHTGSIPVGAALGIGSVVAASFAVGIRSSLQRRAERQTVGESRQRLTRAESRLETALRGDAKFHFNASTGRFEVVSGPRSEQGQQHNDEAVARAQRALTLAELWETTHARLGLYHDIATGQAKVSFRNAQVSMVIGFVLLVFFVLLALNASTTAGVIVAGGLGAVSAALAGFVSKTFIRSQEAAATHLRSYFDQPLELSRYLAAERLISGGDLSQEQRAEVLSALVQAMVAPPAPPTAGGPAAGQ
ncbi:hypothetical protein QFZ75_000035 [Streptomyces sp. V3I8]|uniref:TRADD-N-associated membrane domain-containing protein n=1 Tax=Streptomyces sp. V3I8 TaxID=3042279 RepID=UPI002780F357|nr:hypothetical protein [Streptomyces sp. V3I8]MDQ1033619.1 hypothetical protein [Streptomyces sp. V3I8]